MIEGVSLIPLQQIHDERGKVMHMLRVTDPYFDKLGEIYFSCTYPGVVKGWHKHSDMTLNYAAVSGAVKVVLFDVNGGFILSDQNQDLLQMSYSFLGSVLDRSSVDISNVIVSGPKGNIASVSSNVVSADVKLVPGVFALHQNYPNPFNPTTEIQFDIPIATQINVSIFNLMGQKVKTLANKQVASGYHVVQWDGTNDKGVSVSTGMYFYTLNTGSHSAMKKMLFLK